MVKKLSLFFAYALFFILALMYFTPKTSLYYTLETELKKYEVVISNEDVQDRGFSLNISDLTLYAKDINSAKVENVNIKVFALYNSVKIENISLSSVAATFIPINIDEVTISYSIFNPFNVVMRATGGFGVADGSFHILDRALHLDVVPSDKMIKKYKNSMRKLKKNENGSYSYDKTF